MDNKTKRVSALIIDLIVIGFIYSIGTNLLNLNLELGSIEIFNLNVWYGYSFIFVLYLIYFFLFDVINEGITFGKMLTKIRIVSSIEKDSNYNKLTRSFLKVLGLMIFPITGFLFLLNGFTIHDKSVNTETIIYQ
ncbi:RDD family protein [Aequorivita viscosa]|nr:RDD family protein [Aequorivita viscosa]